MWETKYTFWVLLNSAAFLAMEIQQQNTNMQTFFHFANIAENITKYASCIVEFISFMVVLLDINLFINRNRRKQQHCKACNSELCRWV